jgi:protein ImuA
MLQPPPNSKAPRLRIGRAERLARLHARLRASATAGGGVLPFGDPRVDSHLPNGGLPLGQLHEVLATGIEAETGAIAAAFIASLLARLPAAKPIFWIAPENDLYAPGLAALGLNPGRLVMVATPNNDATLAAMETCLREGAAVAVTAEIGRLDRTASRRLHLGCLRHATTGFVLRRWPHGTRSEDREATAAVTRWQLAAAPSARVGKTPGASRWQVSLLHARGGREGEWIMESGSEADPLRVVAGLADHTPAPARHRAV